MSERKVRWGVLSTANIGRAAVLPAIQASRNGELLAVASRDKERAASFAAQLGIAQAYGSYEALLAAEDIDAVYIPLPNSMHYEWSIKAAQAGKHVMCEKPLALSAAHCREMEDAARQQGVRLMEAFMYRFHPRTERVQALVAGGAVGELGLIHAAFTFRVKNQANIRLQAGLGGGALMDVGCYCVNVSRTLAGAEPVEVQGFARWGATGVDEQFVGCLRFASGLLAQFDCALTLERREVYELSGTEGALWVPTAFLPGSDNCFIYERHGRQGETAHEIEGVDEYRLMVEHFADCVITGAPVRYAAFEAAANMRVIEALLRSARQNGQPVQL